MEEITPICSCTFKIVNETFSCLGARGDFENTVVFRGRIIVQASAAIVAANDVVNVISNWVKSSPLIAVDLATLVIDPRCPAMLASTDSDDCLAVTEQPSSSSSSSSSSDFLSIGAIVGAVIAVVVVILVVAIIVVIVFVYLKRKGNYR